MTKSEEIQRRRAASAVLILFVLTLVMVSCAKVMPANRRDSVAVSNLPANGVKVLEALEGHSDAYDIASLAIPQNANVNISDSNLHAIRVLPDCLDELGLPRDAGPYLIDDANTTVEYESTAGARDSLASISSSMEEAGWHRTDLGGLLGATFTKDDGSIRWALVTCTTKGASVDGASNSSVLIRVMRHG